MIDLFVLLFVEWYNYNWSEWDGDDIKLFSTWAREEIGNGISQIIEYDVKDIKENRK